MFSKSPETSLELSRVLLIFLYTIKELATGQLRRIKDNLQNAAPEILQVLVKIYSDKVAQWQAFLQGGSGSEDSFRDAAERSLLALRILRRLIIAGYDCPNRDSVVGQFWNQLSLQLDECLSFILQGYLSINASARSLVEKHLIQIAKFHLEMVKSHPAGFALLPNSVDLARAYWKLVFRFSKTFGSQTPTPTEKIGHDGDVYEEKPAILEELSLKGLLLLRGCLKMVFNPAQTFKYQHAEDKEEKKRSVEIMKNTLLTESFVREMMETIVTQFFVFRSRDLREWAEEPEEWERREEGEGDVWEFSIRSCSEKLFLDLVINFNNLLVEPLLSFFANVAGNVIPQSFANSGAKKLSSCREYQCSSKGFCLCRNRHSSASARRKIGVWHIFRIDSGSRSSNPTSWIQHLATSYSYCAGAMVTGKGRVESSIGLSDFSAPLGQNRFFERSSRSSHGW